MSIKSSLEKWEKRIGKIEHKLGEEVSRISKPKSMFGKVQFLKEQIYLLFAGNHIINATTLIDPTKAVTIYSLFPYTGKERGRVSREELQKSLARLRDIGV